MVGQERDNGGIVGFGHGFDAAVDLMDAAVDFVVVVQQILKDRLVVVECAGGRGGGGRAGTEGGQREGEGREEKVATMAGELEHAGG